MCSSDLSDYMQVLENKDLLLQQQTKQLNLQTQYVAAAIDMLKALGGRDA